MRLSLFVFFLFILHYSFSQNQDGFVTLSVDSVNLESIFDSVSLQTGYYFSYNPEILTPKSRYTIEADSLPIDRFLSKLLVGTNLKYSFYKNQIIISSKKDGRLHAGKKKTFSLRGVVTDENNLPLKDVNVFLDGTTLGAATDIEGNYDISEIPTGSYVLIFSYIGYERSSYELVEHEEENRVQDHQLELYNDVLEEVEIVAGEDDNWFFYLEVFKQDLLGTSRNAEYCQIMNPGVMDFHYDKDENILTAFAREPIQIINYSLGYRIFYYLESYERNGVNLKFRGQVQFQNQSPNELLFKPKRIIKERRKNYHGSFNHFKKALISNDLRSQGYKIYQTDDLRNLKSRNLTVLHEEDILVFNGYNWQLNFNEFLLSVYKKERESIDFLRDFNFSSITHKELLEDYAVLSFRPGKQKSVIRLLNGPVYLDLNGQILDKFGLSYYGYWSWERLANWVPLNYDSKFDQFSEN